MNSALISWLLSAFCSSGVILRTTSLLSNGQNEKTGHSSTLATHEEQILLHIILLITLNIKEESIYPKSLLINTIQHHAAHLSSQLVVVACLLSGRRNLLARCIRTPLRSYVVPAASSPRAARRGVAGRATSSSLLATCST
jgi:hypothetical protein